MELFGYVVDVRAIIAAVAAVLVALVVWYKKHAAALTDEEKIVRDLLAAKEAELKKVSDAFIADVRAKLGIVEKAAEPVVAVAKPIIADLVKNVKAEVARDEVKVAAEVKRVADDIEKVKEAAKVEIEKIVAGVEHRAK